MPLNIPGAVYSKRGIEMVGNGVVDLSGARAFTVTVKVDEAGPQVVQENRKEELTEVKNSVGFLRDLKTLAVLLMALLALFFPNTAEVILKLLLL